MAEAWRQLRQKWMSGKPPPADSTGYIEPIKARFIDLWANRPRFGPLGAYRWWWFKSWTLLLGSGLAVWQGAFMLARPSDPVRLDDVMATIPTLHAAVWKMVMRDIARPMEIAKDARVYDYFGFFLEARPMQVPYEVSVTEHWSVGHFRKPTKKPPPPRSAEFDGLIYREMGMVATEPNIELDDDEEGEGREGDALPKDTAWNFDLYTHEHLLILKFYVHMLRDTVDYLFENAGYDHAYSLQPYTWNHVTAVLAIPEPGTSAPYQLKSVTIYDRVHDTTLVWGENESDMRVFNISQYDSWRWNPLAVPISAPIIDYQEVLTRYMPRWATRPPDSKGIPYDHGWSVRFFKSWLPLTAETVATETGSQHDFRPMMGQYDDLYEHVQARSPLATEQMAKVYKPSPTGKWAHEYARLTDIK